jgi:hypothetical protein
LGYKLALSCGPDRDSKVICGFITTELEINPDNNEELRNNITTDTDINGKQYRVIQLGQHLVSEIFAEFNPLDIIPKHGPGAVASGEEGRSKWEFKVKYEPLHAVYPYFEYFVSCRGELYDRLSWYRNLQSEPKGTAKVILVPKDSRGPRLISEEPLEYQFIQQGLCRRLMPWIERHPLTSGRVNFKSQVVNRDLAMLGSRYDTVATLDMKEASDRVSSLLVRTLFAKLPLMLRALFAARSHRTKLQDGTVLDLHKFAPMGSALCFPIEAIVHYVLAVASIVEGGYPLKEALRSVWVYGDDLIIDRQCVPHVLEHFPRYGLRFNLDKCFIQGPFRESCGMDAFKGVNIAPIRWRKPWAQRLDGVTAQSFCSFASLLYQGGYLQAAEVVWKHLERALGQKLPTVPLDPTSDECPQPLKVSFLARITRMPYLHIPNRFRKRCVYQQVIHEGHFLFVSLTARESEWNQWGRLFFNQTVTGQPARVSELEHHRLLCPEDVDSHNADPSIEYSLNSTLKSGWIRFL